MPLNPKQRAAPLSFAQQSHGAEGAACQAHFSGDTPIPSPFRDIILGSTGNQDHLSLCPILKNKKAAPRPTGTKDSLWTSIPFSSARLSSESAKSVTRPPVPIPFSQLG